MAVCLYFRHSYLPWGQDFCNPEKILIRDQAQRYFILISVIFKMMSSASIDCDYLLFYFSTSLILKKNWWESNSHYLFTLFTCHRNLEIICFNLFILQMRKQIKQRLSNYLMVKIWLDFLTPVLFSVSWVIITKSEIV